MRIADRYRLEAVLGRGGMGEVWRASDEVLGRAVAVKVLKTGKRDAAAGERFRREARAGAVVNSPHVVGVHDFGVDGDGSYLVMELVEGWTLAGELQRAGALEPGAGARIVAQAAEGLAAAHREGVVHRDIKPSNLLVTSDGTVKVADFGIARFSSDPTDEADGCILGTSYYLAPERAMGEPAGPAADVYSLGCVFYQLLAGEPPFVADTPTGVMRLHLGTCPARSCRLHRDFQEYLCRMLAKDPAERPHADEVVEWCWQTYLSSPIDRSPNLANHREHRPCPTTQLATVDTRDSAKTSLAAKAERSTSD